MNKTTADLVKYIFDTDLELLDRQRLIANKGVSGLCLLYKTNMSVHDLKQTFGDNIQLNNISTASVPEVISEISKHISIKEFEPVFDDGFGVKESHSSFKASEFIKCCTKSGLAYPDSLIRRFVASLLTKPFVILTGLSGSGKTKLAQAFAQWICRQSDQYKIVAVGSDWTNRDPLLGYPSALDPREYKKPDTGVLELMLNAIKRPNLPHFLILDEMNLSHVERYFADFLSVMESKEMILLHSTKSETHTEKMEIDDVPSKIPLPSNLFIVGTVNIDETTHMFSPKVLDRANTIEFRISQSEMAYFLDKRIPVKMEALTGQGAEIAEFFLQMSEEKSQEIPNGKLKKELLKFFAELQKMGAEFGYRSANEMIILINHLMALSNIEPTDEITDPMKQLIDIAIIQKLLPKLHGSRRKLCPVLEKLASFCVDVDIKVLKEKMAKDEVFSDSTVIQYQLSYEKISRMYRSAIENGFASFAEA